MAQQVSLAFAYSYPGKYALTALAGAVESSGALLFFPRDTPALIATVRARAEAGDRVLVAFSFYSPSFPESVAALAALRAALPGAFTALAGGVHATAETEAVLEAGFDLVCVGEGEQALLELLSRARAGVPLQGAAGFAFRSAGVTHRAPKPAPVALDAFAPFAVSHGHFGPIELTRGCIYACRFCQTPFMSKARFRHRSVESTRAAVAAMAAAGKWDVRFVSPSALSYGATGEEVNLEAIDALLGAVRAELGTRGRLFFGTFPSEVRPEHVTPEALRVLSKWVDNDNLVIGGQSGSNAVLQASHRGHDVAAIERAAEVALEFGFLPNVDFILGLPGETPDDVRSTVELMHRLADKGARVHSHTFMPLPGTPFRDAPAGDVPPDARAELERLASQKKAYGHWKAQVAVARELASRRRTQMRSAMTRAESPR